MISLVMGGGEALQKKPSIFYILNSKNRVFNQYFNRHLSYEKNTFADNLRVEPTIFYEKNIIFFETFILAILREILH